MTNVENVENPTPRLASKSIVPAWMLKLDPWEAATGVFIAVVWSAGDVFKGPIHDVAEHIIELTVLCELCMFGIIFGVGVTEKKDAATADRAFSMIFGMICYIALFTCMVWKLREFYLIPQATWILVSRLRPRGGTRIFSAENARRFYRTCLTGYGCAWGQIAVIAILALLLKGLGLAPDDSKVVRAPAWLEGIGWSCFYFELAWLLPKVEAKARQPG